MAKRNMRLGSLDRVLEKRRQNRRQPVAAPRPPAIPRGAGPRPAARPTTRGGGT